MELQPETQKALKAWIETETWHSGHDADMDRFYDFVDQYQKDHGFTIDEPSLRETINRIATGGGDEKVRKMIREYIELAYRILDFLKRTRR